MACNSSNCRKEAWKNKWGLDDIQAHASHVLTKYYIGTTTPNFSWTCLERFGVTISLNSFEVAGPLSAKAMSKSFLTK